MAGGEEQSGNDHDDQNDPSFTALCRPVGASWLGVLRHWSEGD